MKSARAIYSLFKQCDIQHISHLAGPAIWGLFIFIAVIPLYASAQRPVCQDYRLTNPIVGVYPLHRRVDELTYHNGLYYSPGDSVRIYDFTEGKGFEQVSRLQMYGLGSRWLTCDGTRVYCKVGNVMWVSDISDPLNDQYLGGIQVDVDKDAFRIRDNLVYACEDRQLKILDVTDIDEVQILDQMPLPDSYHHKVIELYGIYLVVGVSGSGIMVFNIANPNNIVLASAYYGDISVIRMKFFDNFMVTFGDSPTLQGFDLEDPNNIINLGQILDDGGYFGASEDHIYIPDNDGLSVYSVGNFPQLEFMHVVPQLGRSGYDLHSNNGLTYTATSSKTLTFVDLGIDPTQEPPLLDVVGEMCWDRIKFHDQLLFSSNYSQNNERLFRIVDASPDGNFEILSEISMTNSVQEIGFSEEIVVLGKGGDFVTIDVSDPENPELLETFGIYGTRMADFVIDENLMYAVGNKLGNEDQSSVSIMSLDDPRDPIVLATSHFDGQINFIVQCNEVFAVWVPDFGLKTIRVAFDGGTVGSHGTDLCLETIGSLEIHRHEGNGDMICVSDVVYRASPGVVDIIYCGIPEHPKLLKTIRLPSYYYPYQLDYHMGHLYVGAANAGVAVIDVMDPASAEIVGYINTMGETNGVAVGNSLVYAGVHHYNEDQYHLKAFPLQCSDYSMSCDIDIRPQTEDNLINCESSSNGVVPVAILTTYDFDALTVDHTTVRFGPDQAEDAHQNNHATFRHEEDVDGDGDLDLVLHFHLTETGIECGDNQATLTGSTYDGWQVTGTDMIQTFGGDVYSSNKRAASVAPNPFNPRTTVSFRTDATQLVRVAVYDIRGRLVSGLLDQILEAGDHEAVWQGKNSSGAASPSGEYFFRVETGPDVQIQKAILVR